MSEAREPLFAYGTLQLESVQLRLFGRRLAGKPDALAGYRQVPIELGSPGAGGTSVYPIVQSTGDAADTVPGTVYELDARELAIADGYETEDYRRVRVALASGRPAWVYVDARQAREAGEAGTT